MVFLGIAGLFALRLWSNELTEIALVPTTEFTAQPALEINAYENPALWLSRPGTGAGNPARWQPAFAEDANAPPAEDDVAAAESVETAPRFAVFFVHPTSYLERSNWNAPLEDQRSQERARLFVQGMASPFRDAAEVWAPRYRQATFGAFLTDKPAASAAIDAAYRDIEQAFDVFVDSVDRDTPIVLAGHSQGALHILRLLQERIAGTRLQDRVAMVYPVGWPISIEHDLPALPLPVCATSDDAQCIATWSTFAEPADPAMLVERFRESPGFDGQKRGDGPVVCVNPLTGTAGGEAPASANTGTLVPNEALDSAELVPGMVPARCAESGLLLIGDPPELGPYVLPGNNYHVYDIPLFWENLRQDVVHRVSEWTKSRP